MGAIVTDAPRPVSLPSSGRSWHGPTATWASPSRWRCAPEAAAGEALGIESHPCATVREATLASRVAITCTSSHQAFLDLDDVRPGSLVAGVGADNPQRAELAPALIAAARVVDAGVRGELATAIRDPRPPGTNERVVFRSTGLAIEDLAIATRLAAKRGIDCG